MRLARLPILLLAAALLPAGALAQATRTSAPSLAQAERNSVELRQGMSLEEVQKLLGKPRRTSLRAGIQGQGALQWSYFWPTSSSSSERSLQIEFAAKTPDQWFVSSWGWSSY